MYNKTMRQKIILIVACFCLVVYVAALGIAARQIYSGAMERRVIAEKEFFDLVDTASSAAALGFMSQPFQDAVRDGIMKSSALEGAIISGPYGNEYVVERRPGVISWAADAPRFADKFGLSRNPFFSPLRVEGARNVTISAVCNYIDYGVFTGILKTALIIVLSSLALAFGTLIVVSVSGKKGKGLKTYKEDFSEARAAYKDIFKENSPSSEWTAGGKEAAGEEEAGQEFAGAENTGQENAGQKFAGIEIPPQGLYSPRGNISWEAYIHDRLSSELSRCASYEQDLVFIIMEFRAEGNIDGIVFNNFADITVKYFTHRDLIFEWGNQGIAVIIPSVDIDQGFSKAEEFHDCVLGKLKNNLPEGTELCMGLSSRSGRLVDAGLVIFEASSALIKAREDPVSVIIAFKSDPEKYRAFIAAKEQR